MKTILDILQFANGETENIQIAQGKYHLKTSLKAAFDSIKKKENGTNRNNRNKGKCKFRDC